MDEEKKHKVRSIEQRLADIKAKAEMLEVKIQERSARKVWVSQIRVWKRELNQTKEMSPVQKLTALRDKINDALGVEYVDDEDTEDEEDENEDVE